MESIWSKTKLRRAESEEGFGGGFEEEEEEKGLRRERGRAGLGFGRRERGVLGGEGKMGFVSFEREREREKGLRFLSLEVLKHCRNGGDEQRGKALNPFVGFYNSSTRNKNEYYYYPNEFSSETNFFWLANPLFSFMLYQSQLADML